MRRSPLWTLREAFAIRKRGGPRPERRVRRVTVRVCREDGAVDPLEVVARIDTPIEGEYYRHGGILPMVLRGVAGIEVT